ncbi:MAG TPA: FecR family protein [Bryobacteraceae bacterium]
MTTVVCLGQFLPSDASNYAARVVTSSGQVSVLKDLQPWAISVGDNVQVTQVIVTGSDGHAVLQVSDGSTIEVYPNSRFVFRKNPGNWRDLVDVFLGRVRVHIEHFGTVPNPNRVLTPTAVISVRGTTFDVTVNDDDETTTVEVEEGTVEVQHALLGGNAAIVNAGETFRVYRNEPIAQRLDKGNAARQAIRIVVNVIAIVGRASGPGKVTLPGGGSGGVGDTGGTPPPSTPPPPPPPPPAAP